MTSAERETLQFQRRYVQYFPVQRDWGGLWRLQTLQRFYSFLGPPVEQTL